ncbi:hypothetical protein HZQ28_05165 [Elizabethkingia anophelis]|uniref:hypothetical protein n=1 Tax=Elizabethkingia sp. M8 TaxID=2796140 RepID=UPI001908C296|nr:hypothetical protein [Elizabethkingia sp. M8]MCT3943558.1 hypothetical protein [Elizabethkingia anophelis]MCT3993875.1 hypothetical protein [Elizabethkingia anophelis]MCT3996827.1 hypothetical protein [Elizabethkingia anophelis]MCT4253418.1 hypothetical protein [Elizabethkingia anophelis]MDV3719115.1 hypothetical protein [Elizabethkingia anophelis]
MKNKSITFIVFLSYLTFSCSQKNEKVENKISVENTNTENSISTEIKSTTKENEINDTIIKIVKAYQKKDENTLNSLIYKDYGLTFLFARGVSDNISTAKRISFNEPVPEYLPYETNFETQYLINETDSPVFSCETESWNKPSGIYVDMTSNDKFLSTIAISENKLTEETIWNEKEIKLFEEIERKSHKVTLIGKNQETFIFYIAKINNKWYLTAIDRFEVCSA